MNGTYHVEVVQHARRELDGFPKPTIERIQNAIMELATDPRSASNTKKMKGSKSIYSKRIGDHRILYEIDDQQRRIIVHRVGDRKDVYKNL